MNLKLKTAEQITIRNLAKSVSNTMNVYMEGIFMCRMLLCIVEGKGDFFQLINDLQS